MKLTIVYTTQIKAALGVGSQQVDLPPPKSTGELLAILAEQLGPDFRRLTLDAAGRPLPSVLVCVGDEQVPAGAPLTLRDGDVVTLLSAISGG